MKREKGYSTDAEECIEDYLSGKYDTGKTSQNSQGIDRLYGLAAYRDITGLKYYCNPRFFYAFNLVLLPSPN